MKIGALSLKVGTDVNLDLKVKQVLDRIKYAVNQRLDTVVAGDFALSPGIAPTKFKVHDSNSREEIIKILSNISNQSPKTLIIPGTMSWVSRPGKMAHSCPVFLNGNHIREFYKETDAGESELARLNKLEYERGDFRKNWILFKDKKIAIEICRDYGKQPIDRDVWLELILSHDRNAGFIVKETGFERYALLCDTYYPIAACCRFQKRDRESQVVIQPKKESLDSNDFLKVYELK